MISLGIGGAALGFALEPGSGPPASPQAPPAVRAFAAADDRAFGDPLSPGRAEGMEQRVQTVLRRPIFRSDRRPANEPARAIASGAAKFRLSGVLIAPGDKRATFETAASAERTMAREGAYIGRYQIQAIQHDGVVVLGPEGRQIWQPSVRDPATAWPPIATETNPAATRPGPDAPAMPASSPIFGGAFHAALHAP